MIPPVKGYRPWTPHQVFLLPPSPHDWLPEEHLAYFILDTVEELDLSEIQDAIQEKDGRGTRPYDPSMMTALLLYGYCVGVGSSRKLEEATHTDVAFRVLTGEQHPDHSAICAFRRGHLKALKGLFRQILRLCQKAGLVKLGHVALDGTKVQANASKHKAMSYERMLKTEAELGEEIEKLFEQAEKVDRQEDAVHGEKHLGTELPEELRRRESRRKKIREAKASLEAEAAHARALKLAEQAKAARQKAEPLAEGDREKAAQAAAKAEERARIAKAKAVEKADERVAQTRAQAEAAALQAETPAARRYAGAAKQAQEAAERDRARIKDDDDEPPAGTGAAFPEHRVPSDAEGNPEPTAQRNFTDADSRIMKKGSDYLQGYNCQLAVDESHQIIVACGVTNQAPDVEHLPPMLDAIEQNCGATPERLTSDSGYFSEENIGVCEQKNVDAYIAVGRQKHGTPEMAPAAESESKAKMRQKLATPEGRKIYSRRKAVVEPVNGQIKEARGFRRFLLRGTDKVRAEWAVICATHNLLKLFRAGRSGKTIPCAAALAAAT